MTKANDLASLLDANGDVVSSALDNVPAAPTLTSLGIPNHDDITVDASGNVGIGGSETTVFNGTGGDMKFVVIGDDSTTTITNNSAAAIAVVNTNQTAGNLAGLHFARADTDNTPNYSGASIVAQFPEAQVTGQYPKGDLAFLTSTATNSAPSEKMRLTAAGNFGIGTNSPATKAEIYGTAAAGNLALRVTNTAADGYSTIQVGDANAVVFRNGSAQSSYGGASSLNILTIGGHPITLGTSNTVRLTVDPSGNVGIGAVPETTYVQKTTLRLSTTASLIAGTSYYPYPYYIANNLNYDASDNLKYIASSGGALLSVNAHAGGSFSFYTAPTGTAGATASLTERMHLTTAGKLCVGTSSAVSSAMLNIVPADTNRIINTRSFNTSAQYHNVFQNNSGTLVGGIIVSTTATSYNETSDYRLKENVTYDWDAITRLKQLKPAQFNFISTPDETRDGFLAHELQEVSPQSVSGTKDAMRDEEYEVSAATGDIYTPAVEATYDEDGVELTAAIDEVVHSADVERPDELAEGQQWRETTEAVMGTRSVPDFQGVDQSKLVPILTKALIEAVEKIEQLEARIAALETVE